MKKYLDKLKRNIIVNKKMIVFFGTLIITGIVAGSLFGIIIKGNDKSLVSEYINTFFNNINNNGINYVTSFINSIISNSIFILIIWILGISIIGCPITIFMYFSKAFSLGFTIASLIVNYNIKGVLYAIIYIIPSQIFFILGYTLLMIYSVSLSLKLCISIIKKKSIDFKYIMNRYLIVLLITCILIVIGSIFESFVMPYLLKFILSILK